jgi:hypothetical protein
VTEARVVAPDAAGPRRVDAERQALFGQGGFAPACCASPDGPDRAGTPRDRPLRGTPVLPQDDVYTNHIHADDLARAVRAAPARRRSTTTRATTASSRWVTTDPADLYGRRAAVPRHTRRSSCR